MSLATILVVLPVLAGPKPGASLADVLTHARSTECSGMHDFEHPDCTQSVEIKKCDVVLTVHTSDRYDVANTPCWKTTTKTLSFSLGKVTAIDLDRTSSFLRIIVPTHRSDPGVAPACNANAGPEEDDQDSVGLLHLGEHPEQTVKLLEDASQRCGAKPKISIKDEPGD